MFYFFCFAYIVLGLGLIAMALANHTPHRRVKVKKVGDAHACNHIPDSMTASEYQHYMAILGSDPTKWKL